MHAFTVILQCIQARVGLNKASLYILYYLTILHSKYPLFRSACSLAQAQQNQFKSVSVPIKSDQVKTGVDPQRAFEVTFAVECSSNHLQNVVIAIWYSER